MCLHIELSLRMSEHEMDKFEPDAVLGHRVRFGCGVLLGLVFALWLHLYVGPFTTFGAVFVTLPCMIVCGLLATRYGDSFWHWVIALLRH